MAGEFLAGLEDGGGAGIRVEYDVTRVIPGDIETVRSGLAHAMEQLGYRLVNENPLQGRRKARGLGKSLVSNNILDYKSNLTVHLKKISGSTTRAIFDYSICYSMLYQGDKATLQKEADALISLMNARTNTTNCSGCGTVISIGTRYCRQCGAPNQSATPSEVDVYQMTAGANTSYKNQIAGTIFVIIALLMPLFLLLIDPDSPKYVKLTRVITIIAGILGISGLAMLINAVRITRRMLKFDEDDAEYPAFSRQPAGAPTTASLPPLRDPVEAPSSITEETTSLLENK